MKLEMEQQVTLNGTVYIEGQTVISMSANIPNNTGAGSMNQFIQNKELYDNNRTEVRKLAQDFQNKVYEIEDELYTKEG